MHRLITMTVSAMAIVAWSAGCDSDERGETGQGGSATTTQTGTGGHGGQGALGGEGGEGGAATGGGGAGGSDDCVDTSLYEPNDDPADAVNLLVITDNDPAVWPAFDGVIDGTADVDWYTFLGTDEPAAYVDPELTFDATGFGLTLCAYFWCTDPGAWGPPEIGSGGAPAHDCPPGSSEATVDLSNIDFGGVDMGVAPGCCTEAGEGSLHLGEDLIHTFWTPFTCAGLTDDMKVFISVAAPHGWPDNTCEPYDVSYHY